MFLKDKTKTIVVLGVMAALGTIFSMLGTFITVNTLFFTAAAAFLVGIAVCCYGMKYGFIYFCVCAALDFIMNPNKLNVLLYMALAAYLLLSEGTWRLMNRSSGQGETPSVPTKKKIWGHRLIRLVIFEAVYLPFLLLAPWFFLSGKLLEVSWYRYVMIPAGIVAWIIYDQIYFSAKKFIHTRVQLFSRL